MNNPELLNMVMRVRGKYDPWQGERPFALGEHLFPRLYGVQSIDEIVNFRSKAKEPGKGNRSARVKSALKEEPLPYWMQRAWCRNGTQQARRAKKKLRNMNR